MIVPGPQICCRYKMCTPQPWNEQSQWKLRSRDICEKAKQNSARNNAKCSKCFQFLCNNRDRTWFFNTLTFARSVGRCWKPRPSASVFNTSHGTWRMLMHEKPRLIPILNKYLVRLSASRLKLISVIVFVGSNKIYAHTCFNALFTYMWKGH